MGWTSIRARKGLSRLEMLASCSSFQVGSTWKTEDGEILVEALKSAPGGVYGIVRKTLRASGKVLRFALVVLTEQRNGEFAYKSLSEFEGPTETRYPSAYLRRLSTPEELADGDEARLERIRDWRQSVEASSRQTGALRSLKAGSVVTFAEPIRFVISGEDVMVTRFVVLEWGRRKRLTAHPDDRASFNCRIQRTTWASREYKVESA